MCFLNFLISASYALWNYQGYLKEGAVVYLDSFSCDGMENKWTECSYNSVDLCIGSKEAAVLCTSKIFFCT